MLLAAWVHFFYKSSQSTCSRWLTPVCVFFMYIYFRTRFHWTQILVYSSKYHSKPPSSSLLQGDLICIGGLGLLMASDQLTDKDWDAVNKGKGDALMILGATLYDLSTSLIKSPHYW